MESEMKKKAGKKGKEDDAVVEETEGSSNLEKADEMIRVDVDTAETEIEVLFFNKGLLLIN